MHALLAEVLATALLGLVPTCAVVRPWGWPKAVVAVPTAAVVTGTGVISLEHARDEAARRAPVIGFLAPVLVLAKLCDDEGLFRACGSGKYGPAAVRIGRVRDHSAAEPGRNGVPADAGGVDRAPNCGRQGVLDLPGDGLLLGATGGDGGMRLRSRRDSMRLPRAVVVSRAGRRPGAPPQPAPARPR